MEETADSISLMVDEKEKELQKAIASHEVIEQEKLLIEKEILILRVKNKDLEAILSKSSNNIKQIGIMLRLLRSRFWSSKNG